MIGRLSEKSRCLLEDLLQDDPDLLREVATAASPSEEALDRIHEILSRDLIKRGLDENLEPTEHGEALEALGIELSKVR